MQLAQALDGRTTVLDKRSLYRPQPRSVSPTSAAAATPRYAHDEINAYIAIRDGLLLEAEETVTRAKLDSAAVANDFVEKCLMPARSPYQAQCLPEAHALRERKRCDAARARIARLRATLA